MIDFKNGTSFLGKLNKVDDNEYIALISHIFVMGESIIATYKGARDGAVFTNKRVILISVQGVTVIKLDITSLPYNKIQSFTVETDGVTATDRALDLWCCDFGKVRFEFQGNTNLSEICKVISKYILSI